MLFSSSSYVVFSLFDTADTLSMRSIECAFPNWMVFPSSWYDVFTLFDTAHTLFMGFMKRAFPIIERDPWSALSLPKGKSRIEKDGCSRLSIQLSNYPIMCINCIITFRVSFQTGCELKRYVYTRLVY